MKAIILLIISSFLFCYLQWPNNSMFVAEIEWELLFNNATEKENFLHPAIALPLAGQLLLLISLFQRIPARRLVIAGISLMGLLVLFILFVGIISQNNAMMCTPLPFIGLSVFYVITSKKTYL